MKNTTCATSCEACMMPLDRDPAGDKRENPKYCSYCYSGGKLHPDDAKDIDEFRQICFVSMRKNGTPWILAKLFAWMIRFTPYWKARNTNK